MDRETEGMTPFCLGADNDDDDFVFFEFCVLLESNQKTYKKHAYMSVA